jgi:molybdopterin biosynthesis enzyme
VQLDSPPEVSIRSNRNISPSGKHLHDEDVAVLMEAGAEKLRYVSGWAVAVNSKGDLVEIGLSDIYEKAKHLGKNITQATY